MEAKLLTLKIIIFWYIQIFLCLDCCSSRSSAIKCSIFPKGCKLPMFFTCLWASLNRKLLTLFVNIGGVFAVTRAVLEPAKISLNWFNCSAFNLDTFFYSKCSLFISNLFVFLPFFNLSVRFESNFLYLELERELHLDSDLLEIVDLLKLCWEYKLFCEFIFLCNLVFSNSIFMYYCVRLYDCDCRWFLFLPSSSSSFIEGLYLLSRYESDGFLRDVLLNVVAVCIYLVVTEGNLVERSEGYMYAWPDVFFEIITKYIINPLLIHYIMISNHPE